MLILTGEREFYIEICLALPFLYAVADQNDKLAEQARGRLGFEKAYGDWRKLIEDPAVDIIDITTPNNLHAETALAAIEAGKHVFCEKPMAVKIEDARRMAAAAKKADVRTMVAFNNLKTPAALVAKQIIERGEFGRRSVSVGGSTRVFSMTLFYHGLGVAQGNLRVLEH